jgi:hypothetical protein
VSVLARLADSGPWMQQARRPQGLLQPLALLLLAASGALCQPVLAQSSRFDNGYTPPTEEVIVEDLEPALPAFPDNANLVRFDAGAATGFSFYIDVSAVSLGKDNIVRYVLVARSGAGALNISFEGIRCGAGQRERKLYAFGRVGAGWSRARRIEWQTILGNAANRHHAELADEYFCPGGILRRGVGLIQEAIRRQGRLPEAPVLPQKTQ